MKKFLIAALMGCATMPAQAAQIFTLALDANLTGSRTDLLRPDPVTYPLSPINGTIKLTGSWETGFNSFYAPCNKPGCLKASFVGNQLILRADEGAGALPCYCSEIFTLTFNQPFTGELGLLIPENFVSGTYRFTEGTYAGFTNLGGAITAAYAVPEPATWAMMIGGFAIAGAALRKRKPTLKTA